ncbi:hypothetical protein NYZ99_06435 [Maribacter litopenaei]|uniref:Haem-binding domain-containing protein n=1 Tax=Maribacter litopenaei TaxID=2976127 RepID=A0ABY5YA88_9FLAO|nr:hypothetical protein [Maribacter litopenaei]UWX55975.1 hypothetical protein NYZ99_06435 [Maribacter litopenaei]
MLKTGVFIFQFYLLASLTISNRTYTTPKVLKEPPQLRISIENQDSIKQKAFAVLDLKCNFCHTSKKRLENFTPENMNDLIPKINEQVFVTKKMPKGKNNILTSEEKNSLLIWINKEFLE